MTDPLPAARPRRIKELPPARIAEILAADPRLIVPTGTLEPHGPHLPVGCDTLIVERLADDLSARFGVLRAPTVEYGVNAEHDRSRPGGAAVRKKTLHRQLNDLLAAWEKGGVREFILLTAHQYDPHQEAMATVITAEARVRVVDIFGIRLDDLLEGQTEAMHGDEVDTSLMLYLLPDLVEPTLAQDYMMSREELRRYRRGWLRVPPGSAGSIGRPTMATPEKGRLLYDRILNRVAERIFVAPRSEQ